MTGAHRSFVSYIDKSREYYAAQGYDQPYRWAHNSDSPFTPLTKPLAQSRVALVTTTKLPGNDTLAPYAAPAHPAPEQMQTKHLSWHQGATTTDDLGSFLPLDHLRAVEDAGVIGSAGPRFAGIPTIYSQRRTATWADDVLAMLRDDDVDLAVLIPL